MDFTNGGSFKSGIDCSLIDEIRFNRFAFIRVNLLRTRYYRVYHLFPNVRNKDLYDLAISPQMKATKKKRKIEDIYKEVLTI